VHSENVEEATSLSALEAMASGRPLIAGNVGGLAEIVVDGETGLLVPADARAVAAAILRLAAAPELGARMAAAAREYVVAKHSHLRAAAAYAEVYKRALTGRLAAEAPQAGVAASVVGTPLAEARPVAVERLPWPSLSVLGFTLDVVTLEQAAQWVVASAEEPLTAGPAEESYRRTRVAVSFNPELVVRAQQDPETAAALLDADLCFPDGVGAVWAAGRHGVHGPTERVPGIELAQRVLELAAERGLPVFFLGAADGVAEEAARRRVERLPALRVAGVHHGYFASAEENDVVRTVRESGARVLLVAMGAPRQEVLLHRHRDELGAAVALGVGGSFDVWAGRVKRAPEWTQAAKVEWLHRLASDPRRARRQLALPRYAAQVVRWSPDDYGPPRRGRARGARRVRSLSDDSRLAGAAGRSSGGEPGGEPGGDR
jgi:N-acetylglucosaminyldiphosphoundecaprenol N-acetyl-beta-D-mannosaminyltransferase